MQVGAQLALHHVVLRTSPTSSTFIIIILVGTSRLLFYKVFFPTRFSPNVEMNLIRG
jgi:hypothetical protein